MGGYLKCPKCNSANCELIETGAKSKVNWFGLLLDNKYGNQPLTKKYIEQKKHCKSCGYIW